MVRRLVLGCGDAWWRIVVDAAERGDEVRVVVDAAERTDAPEDAFGETVEVVEGDPTDPGTYPDRADVVLVAGEDGARNREMAERAREAFPDALLVAYAGPGAEGIDRVADRVVDPRAVVVDRLRDTVDGDAAGRTRKLVRALRGIDGRLAVVMHDNPDPDAIGSALALARLADRVGLDADVCYYGDIAHQENRALVNLLNLEFRRFEDPDDAAAYDGIALVDHSRPGVNDGLDPETSVDVVVDHHPPREPVEAGVSDLRDAAGATSTVLVDHFDRLGIVPEREVATALLYGIRIDTKEFTREASEADFEAAAFLIEHADGSVLDQVESPSMSAEVLETLAAAVRNRTVRDDVLVSAAGQCHDRDAISQAADHLLDMEGISVVVVSGIVDDVVCVSGRARGTDVDIGEVLRDALDATGSAGGHEDMAGAQIPLGVLDALHDDAEPLRDVVDDVIAGRVFEVLRNPPTAPRQTDEDIQADYSPEGE